MNLDTGKSDRLSIKRPAAFRFRPTTDTLSYVREPTTAAAAALVETQRIGTGSWNIRATNWPEHSFLHGDSRMESSFFFCGKYGKLLLRRKWTRMICFRENGDKMQHCFILLSARMTYFQPHFGETSICGLDKTKLTESLPWIDSFTSLLLPPTFSKPLRLVSPSAQPLN
jgi:hypothetical protein